MVSQRAGRAGQSRLLASARGGTRTPDAHLRTVALYPLSYAGNAHLDARLDASTRNRRFAPVCRRDSLHLSSGPSLGVLVYVHKVARRNWYESVFRNNYAIKAILQATRIYCVVAWDACIAGQISTM